MQNILSLSILKMVASPKTLLIADKAASCNIVFLLFFRELTGETSMKPLNIPILHGGGVSPRLPLTVTRTTLIQNQVPLEDQTDSFIKIHRGGGYGILHNP